MKQTGKMIFINGKIFTSDRLHPYADCMAVEDGRIAWIGRENRIAWIGRENEMPEVYRQLVSQDEFTDLRGRRVIPGFVDAHMHPVMLADCRKQITVMPPEIHSIEELVQAVKRQRAIQKPGQWILGWGYDEQSLLEKRSPNRHDLDRGCSDARRAERSSGMRMVNRPAYSGKAPAA